MDPRRLRRPGADRGDPAPTCRPSRGAGPAARPWQRIWLIEGPDAEGQAKQLDSLAADGAAVSDEELAGRRSARQAADLATIIYTSGTTGRPKGCELSHAEPAGRRAERDRRACRTSSPSPAGRRCCSCRWRTRSPGSSRSAAWSRAPCSGTPPMSPTWWTTSARSSPRSSWPCPGCSRRSTTAPSSRPRPARLKSRIFAAAAQSAVAWSKTLDAAGQPVPGRQSLRLRAEHALYDRLVYAKLRAATGGRVQYAVSGGAALGERLGHFFRGVGITVLEGYGLTETSPVISANRPDHNKIGTVGPPIPSVTRADRRRRRDPGHRAQRVRRLLAQRGGHQGDGRPGRLAAHRRPGRARRRRLPAGHRAEEGHHRHRGRQERGPGRAGGPAARASAGQPVHGGG